MNTVSHYPLFACVVDDLLEAKLDDYSTISQFLDEYPVREIIYGNATEFGDIDFLDDIAENWRLFPIDWQTVTREVGQEAMRWLRSALGETPGRFFYKFSEYCEMPPAGQPIANLSASQLSDREIEFADFLLGCDAAAFWEECPWREDFSSVRKFGKSLDKYLASFDEFFWDYWECRLENLDLQWAMQWIRDLDDLGYLDATVKFSALWDGLEKYAQQLFSVAKSEFIDYSSCTPLPGLELAVL